MSISVGAAHSLRLAPPSGAWTGFEDASYIRDEPRGTPLQPLIISFNLTTSRRMIHFMLPSITIAALAITSTVAQRPSPTEGSLDPNIEYTTITPYWTDQPTAYPVPDDTFWPTRPVQGSYGFDAGGVPLACHTVCWQQQAVYGICVLNATVPRGNPRDGVVLEFPLDYCLERLCEPAAYNHLYECLNCLVANGGESTRALPPPRTSTSTASASASTSATPDWTQGTPWPAVNADNVNGWFTNVTEYCRANGREMEDAQTSVTATPTASAVYKTTFEDGETVDIADWTQLETISEVKASFNAAFRSAALRAVTSRRGAPEPTQTGGSGVKLAASAALLVMAVAGSLVCVL